MLKGAWGYRGYVMSDWGAVSQWEYALAGLDQESGIQMDALVWGDEMFTHRLRDAYQSGELTRERLSDMVRRILRSLFAVGADQWESTPVVDMARHNEIALAGARQGIVLLKNDGVLPLVTDEPLKVAVIGGYAQLGVPTGTGSGAVDPVGGLAAVINIGGARGLMGNARNLSLLPSSPLKELRTLMPHATIEYDGAYTVAESVLLAQRCDLVIVFGIRVEGEGFDLPDLSLPWGQDAVIDAVAEANPNTVVVLETGNPVAMPWLHKVRAMLQAWYPGQAGGQAIAEVLTGAVNPSGRLPLTFPASLDDGPRPELPGLETGWGTPTTIVYNEGAEIGHRWYARTGKRPMFDFGHGLSYTTFDYANLAVTGGDGVTATFTVTNTGDAAGADVPQVYLTEAAGEKRMRLLGFERVELEPGDSCEVTIAADPRLLARFDGGSGPGQWHIAGGAHRIVLARSAGDPVLTEDVLLTERVFGE